MSDIERDLLCLIIDLDGFVVRNSFQTRELGYYTWQGDKGVHFFDIDHRYTYQKIRQKDRATIDYVSKCVTGLPYRPAQCERPVYQQKDLRKVIRNLYLEFRTEQRTHIGFKGGHFEKDLLRDLSIPYVDIEEWGCPKYDDLAVTKRPDGCGCHSDDERFHCAQAECEAFWNWTRIALDRHFLLTQSNIF